MGISKEKLLSIGGLALSGVIESMDSSRYNEYCKALLTFIEAFPSQEVALKDAFSAKDYAAFSRTLSVLCDVLKSIQAKGLELSCRRLIDELGSQKYNIVEAHLTYLLAEISGLSIDLQMAQRDGEPSDAPTAKMAPGETYLGYEVKQKSILAVDDVSFLLFGLKSILQNTDYKFTGVTSGEAALRYVEKYTPDLFILDIEMPEMNGYELTKRLRRCGQTAPVIFLTGNASIEYVKKALEVGAADFIVKPVNEEQVLEKIRKQIG